MKKTTKKRSYKNAVSIGIAAFASVALLSTGLAAFVLIKNAEEKVTGNIEVAAVSDQSINLTVTALGADDVIRLDANKDDKSGRVQSEKDGKGEKLTQKIDGQITVGENKTVSDNVTLTYQVDILDKAGNDANKDFVENFITAGRLSYLGDFKVGEVMNYTVTLESATESSFEFSFGFAWGIKYGSENPSIYYDKEPGLSVPMDDVEDEEGKVTTEGVKTELDFLKEKLDEYKFQVTVFATNKSK